MDLSTRSVDAIWKSIINPDTRLGFEIDIASGNWGPENYLDKFSLLRPRGLFSGLQLQVIKVG